MNRQLPIALALALAGLASNAVADHRSAPFHLEARAADTPTSVTLLVEATLSFGSEGPYCDLDGVGTLTRAGHPPEPVLLSGCWGPGAATTGPLSLEMHGSEVLATFDLVGPTAALAGSGTASGIEYIASAQWEWGLLDWAGFHEGEPLPCWVPPEPGCCPC